MLDSEKVIVKARVRSALEDAEKLQLLIGLGKVTVDQQKKLISNIVSELSQVRKRLGIGEG